jgi:hypothetical protein
MTEGLFSHSLVCEEIYICALSFAYCPHCHDDIFLYYFRIRNNTTKYLTAGLFSSLYNLIKNKYTLIFLFDKFKFSNRNKKKIRILIKLIHIKLLYFSRIIKLFVIHINTTGLSIVAYKQIKTNIVHLEEA